ncbi:protein kilB [Streptomyces sp. NPDC004111]|uniref:protein kilB n=1 Tax=Streptomyces sp. NPDC004111 TaxID=3364690 RepID=UPI003686AF30
MTASIIAVIGTLLGAIVAGGLQQATARRARREALRDKGLAAVADLAAALADHRRTMWHRESLRLAGADAAAIADARDASYATRSAVTAPQTLVSILLPALAPAAAEAAKAAYALRDATSATQLSDARTEALRAADALTEAAARHLTA